MEQKTDSGLLHLYIGDGKGKTTAAVGLTVRAAGRGKKTLFAQFLKSGETGELASLGKLGTRIIRSARRFGFTFQMDDTEKDCCGAEQRRILAEIAGAVQEEGWDLLVLDEVLDALNSGLIGEAAFRSFLEALPPEPEIAITGRNPPAWLMEQADYITEMKKRKHPFDRGIPARTGIEL
jgi:cob(I)alamin adenosyltransferase